MRVFRHYRNLPDAAQHAVIALGNFDGLHLGHQAVLARARALADELGAPLGVTVFEPHPREFFAPQAEPLRLMTLETKVRHLERLGVNFVFALEFNFELSRMSAPSFVHEVILGGLKAVHVIVGRDFFFGRDRSGDADSLSRMGGEEGFGVTVLDAVCDGEGGGTEYSSTRVREALRRGHPEEAAAMLGHWWSIDGVVIQGERRGRQLGFPTINVDLGRLLHPALGIYAVWVEVQDGPHAGRYPGVAYVGKRPTFGVSDVLLEAHLFDFEGDLYGAAVSVALVAFIRPDAKFGGADELRTQMDEDCAKARAILDRRSEIPPAAEAAGGN